MDTSLNGKGSTKTWTLSPGDMKEGKSDERNAASFEWTDQKDDEKQDQEKLPSIRDRTAPQLISLLETHHQFNDSKINEWKSQIAKYILDNDVNGNTLLNTKRKNFVQALVDLYGSKIRGPANKAYDRFVKFDISLIQSVDNDDIKKDTDPSPQNNSILSNNINKIDQKIQNVMSSHALKHINLSCPNSKASVTAPGESVGFFYHIIFG